MTEQEKKEFEAYKKLYESLLDFGQDGHKYPTVNAKLDYVKARVFDTTVLLKRATEN